jgi:hypothetical protein
MAKIYSARGAGEQLGLTHLETIRRIRRGDIEAQKLGWNWVVTQDAVDKAKLAEWYQKLQAKSAQGSAEATATS